LNTHVVTGDIHGMNFEESTARDSFCLLLTRHTGMYWV